MPRFAAPAVLAVDAARTITLGAARVTVLAGATDTGGAVTLLDYRMPPAYTGPPAHVHPGFDEIFTVLDGTLTVRVGEDVALAGTGDTVLVPGGVPHTFANFSDGPARAMIVLTPAGFESYFGELAQLFAAGPPDPRATAELAARYGVESVGPPLSPPA